MTFFIRYFQGLLNTVGCIGVSDENQLLLENDKRFYNLIFDGDTVSRSFNGVETSGKLFDFKKDIVVLASWLWKTMWFQNAYSH